MLTRLATPDAFWSCPEIGATAFTRLPPDQRRCWVRDEFDDPTVSRAGVSLEVVDGGWIVTNRSASMTDVYLYDVRYGRQPVPPSGSVRPRRLRSWLLLPSSRGADEPHVVAVRIEVPPPAASGGTVERTSDGRLTERADEPTGADLRAGLRRASRILEEPSAVDLIAAYARPYFAVSTRRLEPADNRQVATCLPWGRNRGGRLLTELRAAVWGRAEGQPLDVLVRLLIQHHLVTHEQVCAVRHDVRCGHVPAQVDPNSRCRRW